MPQGCQVDQICSNLVGRWPSPTVKLHGLSAGGCRPSDARKCQNEVSAGGRPRAGYVVSAPHNPLESTATALKYYGTSVLPPRMSSERGGRRPNSQTCETTSFDLGQGWSRGLRGCVGWRGNREGRGVHGHAQRCVSGCTASHVRPDSPVGRRPGPTVELHALRGGRRLEGRESGRLSGGRRLEGREFGRLSGSRGIEGREFGRPSGGRRQEGREYRGSGRGSRAPGAGDLTTLRG